MKMEIDTGATITLMSEHSYKELWNEQNRPCLRPADVIVHTYTGEQVDVVCTATVLVKHMQQEVLLPLHIVKGNGPTLLGRDWLKQLKINWGQVKKLNGLLAHTPTLDTVLRKHDDVFKNELETYTGTKAKIVIETNAVHRFNKPRPLPYAVRETVEHKLDRLQNQGVISPVEFADWAAPMVVVSKPDNSIRICGDYTVTINQATRVDKYPIPRIEDLYTTLAGGEKFTELDLRNAYIQMQLDEQAKQYVTINSHRGLYTYNRLPFGLNSAPAVFQRVVDNLIKNITHTTVYLDDVLVTGLTEAEHLRNWTQYYNDCQM